MISWHKPGQKVVCVKEEFVSPFKKPYAFPVKGTVYTVLDIGMHPSELYVALSLEELQQTIFWRASHFRPVYPTQLEELRKLCKPIQKFDCCSKPFERV